MFSKIFMYTDPPLSLCNALPDYCCPFHNSLFHHSRFVTPTTTNKAFVNNQCCYLAHASL